MAKPYTYEQLRDMTVAQLREIVVETSNEQALEGYSTMHKDHLLPALCKLLGIPTHHAAHGAEKTRIKATIRKLKARRDEALAARDHQRLTTIRRQIHGLKRKLHRMAAQGA